MVDGATLERLCGRKSTGGSNPPPSAKHFSLILLAGQLSLHQCASISSSDLPVVSGTRRQMMNRYGTHIAAKKKNVPDEPSVAMHHGVNCPIRYVPTHSAKLATDIATPPPPHCEISQRDTTLDVPAMLMAFLAVPAKRQSENTNGGVGFPENAPLSGEMVFGQNAETHAA